MTMTTVNDSKPAPKKSKVTAKKEVAPKKATPPASATKKAPEAPAPKVEDSKKLPESRFALIIDDEPANRDFLERLIQQAQFKTKGAAKGSVAREILAGLTEAPAIIVIDSELPDVKGMELLKEFRPQYPNTKIIMATMLDDRSLINSAFENGCDVFIVKPHGFMELFKRLQKLYDEPTILDQLVFDGHGVRPRK